MKKVLVKNFLILIVRFYQICLSPHLGANCRFYPSCSEYALTAIKKYGALHGMYLAVKRILRCQPLSKGGYDPVD